ncbi:uncharacterized protein LOC101863915 [Aplysia californica]|uniref:Uncharacterized protein LOC101863915 n=1 Tax=Aplysia californica TaxID=6500 RepID=A0ABM0JWK4_APLCA|nr:uncharacterized protein LOC101863915 [Aplysia californica]
MGVSVRCCCFLLLSLLLLQHSYSVNVSQICRHRCLYGRGGILCNCNAMHFAGKRNNKATSMYAPPLRPTVAARLAATPDIAAQVGAEEEKIATSRRLRFEGLEDELDEIPSFFASSRGNEDGSASGVVPGKNVGAAANRGSSVGLSRDSDAVSTGSLSGDRHRGARPAFLYPDSAAGENRRQTSEADETAEDDGLVGLWDRNLIDNFIAELEQNVAAAAELTNGFSDNTNGNDNDNNNIASANNEYDGRRRMVGGSNAVLEGSLPYLLFSKQRDRLADRLADRQRGQREGEEMYDPMLRSADLLLSASRAGPSSVAQHQARRLSNNNDHRGDVTGSGRDRSTDHMTKLQRIFHQAVHKSLPQVMFRKPAVGQASRQTGLVSG